MNASCLSFLRPFVIAILSVTSIYGQNNPVQFKNGICTYTENGKYGFQYRERHLTGVIYDTLMMLGSEYSIAKEGKKWSILDANLKNRFFEPIDALDYHYSEELKEAVLVIKSGNKKPYTYSVADKIELLSPLGIHNPLIDDYNRNWNLITDSVDLSIRFPESTEKIHLVDLVKNDDSAFDTILFDSKQAKFFPRTGAPFLRKRPELKWHDFLGGALVVYWHKTEGVSILLNELTGDTVLISDYSLESRIVDHQIRILEIVSTQRRIIERLNVFDQYGKSLYSLKANVSPLLHRGFYFSDALIKEEIPSSDRKGKHVGKCNVYSVLTGDCLLRNVTNPGAGDLIDVFCSEKRGEFYIIYKDKLIRTIKPGRGYRLLIAKLEDKPQTDQPFIEVQYSRRNNQDIKIVRFSTTGKDL